MQFSDEKRTRILKLIDETFSIIVTQQQQYRNSQITIRSMYLEFIWLSWEFVN